MEFNLGFLGPPRDNRIRGDMTNPFAGAEDFEALRDRIMEAFRRDANGGAQCPRYHGR